MVLQMRTVVQAWVVLIKFIHILCSKVINENLLHDFLENNMTMISTMVNFNCVKNIGYI
jgi:hypothetical protein